MLSATPCSGAVPPGALVLISDRTAPAAGPPVQVDLNHVFAVARFTTVFGAFDVQLFPTQTPATVVNFLRYCADNDYDSTFIHRSVPGFVIQGGGFRLTSGLPAIPTDPPVVNEPGISNVRGTVAMAKVAGNPNSATSQWFVNLADNSANLDAQNGGFTVFGQVIGNGMTLVDTIAGLPIYNAGAPFDALPLSNYSGTLYASNFVQVLDISALANLTFSYTVADPGIVSGTLVSGALALTPTGTRGGTTTITVRAATDAGAQAETTFSVTVNHAPVLTPPSPVLPTISEDETDPPGAHVSDWVDARVTDADPIDSLGIAVISVSDINGRWQFRPQPASPWTDIGTVGEANALVLGPDAAVRFVPDARNGGNAWLDFVAWDASDHLASGARADARQRGGILPFSTVVTRATTTVTDMNDPPVLLRVMAAQTAYGGEPFTLSLPPGLFVDPDTGDALTFSAALADGSPLPEWLGFDPTLRLFAGLPPADLADPGFQIRVVATDQAAAAASGVFSLAVIPAVESMKLSLRRGWNLISLSLIPYSPSPGSVFGSRVVPGTCRTWVNEQRAPAGYEQVTRLAAKQGYWVYCPATATVHVIGAAPADGRISLQPGWNLVGPARRSTLPNAPELAGPAWRWDADLASYLAVKPGGVLEVGVGYWLDSATAVTLELPPLE